MAKFPPSPRSEPETAAPACPAARLAAAMAAVVEAGADTATVDGWATLVRFSRRTLEHRCRAAGARPKDALALARVLRATLMAGPGPWCPEDALDVFDDRTLTTLLSRAGVAPAWHGTRPAVRHLLANQAFRVPAAVIRKLTNRYADAEAK